MNISKQQAHAILTGMYEVITKNPDLEDAEFEEISHFALAYILAEVESLAPSHERAYAYDVPTEDGTELAYAIYFTKYNNPLPEGAIPLYASQQESVSPWIDPEFMLPPSSEEVLVYPMPSGVSYTAFHDGDVWRSTEYEYNHGYKHIALPDGYIKGWMPLPKIPE